jgi:DNA-binding MarR family transcriptional regulator
MQPPPTEDDLSPQKRQILLYMWKSGAVGDRTIRLRNLKARLSDDVRSNYVSNLKDLESRLFIRISRGDCEESASLTPLGLAYIRQVQDDNLRFITGDRLDDR